ncbi:MAG: serine/threonine protein kinase [Myxococcales bacterium]|nr:serine/threonine protein kinase [Myxococcales bacterium]
MTLRVGASFGPYTVGEEIGRGGMAVVYEAEHRGLQKRVALKVLHSPDAPGEARFLREGLASSRVSHEHIVAVHDTGVVEGTAYLVMERLEGESLAALLRREGRLDAGRAVDLLMPVLSALSAAHGAGVLHRDLKPENLYLARSRRDAVVPKVLDFGLARLSALDADAARLTGSAALVGTLTHLAPEQVLDPSAASAASDQYALGVVLYECVTGQLPVQGRSVFATLNAVQRGRFPSPRSLVATLDPALDAIIVRAMARTPAARFDSVGALGAALLPFASAAVRAAWAPEFAPSGDAPERDAAITRRPPRRARWQPAAALLGLCVALTGWVVVRRQRSARATPERVVTAPRPTLTAVVNASAAPAPPVVAAAPNVAPSPAPAPGPHASPPRRPGPAATPRRALAPVATGSIREGPNAPTQTAPTVPWMMRTQY